MKIELNPQFKKALEVMEKTRRNVFVTGRAGTGKSTLLQLFRRQSGKKPVVLAPTGVAAVNVAGQTIHSFFGFKPDVTLAAVKKQRVPARAKKLYQKLEAIIIDEISMVRADLLDCADAFLRRHGPRKNQPFGGVQMIFIGDLYQLPPVASGQELKLFKTQYDSPYFFAAHSFADLQMELIELEKIYRQSDQKFINLLNAIRNNSAGALELSALNQRLKPSFQTAPDDFYIHLTTTNAAAAALNQQQLAKLKGKNFYYEGAISGDFNRQSLPADLDLNLKIGAQVMLLNNDRRGRWVNGTVGRIADIEFDQEAGADAVWVELSSGKTELVSPYTWELFEFKFNLTSGQIESQTVGSFTQYPLKLAWAITIHKSQGKTFEKVILDIGRGTFAHGQLYVALSRCTSLEGLILKKALLKRHIWMDWRVVNFMTRQQYKLSEQKCSLEDKVNLIKQAIAEKGVLEIVYLKASDVKSKRLIEPRSVGQMEYLGKTYLGMEALCQTRRELRAFRVDRILEMRRK